MNKATKVLIVLAVVAVVVTGMYLGFSLFDRLCTELAIAHFRARPSAKGAQALADLIDDESATPQDVERMLPLVLTPQVTKRDTYPLGEVPTVQVELPFELTFRNFVVDVNEFVWVNGVSQYGSGMTGARTVHTDSHSLSFYPTPTETGTYTMEIRYRYQLRYHRQRVWQWDPAHGILLPRRRFFEVPPSLRQEPIHECRITVPVEIVVVRKIILPAAS